MTNAELISLEKIAPSSSSSSSATTQASNTSRENTSLKSFSSNFWGEKTIGFDVLSQNLRTSLASVKEFEAFIKDIQQIEDTYAKQMSKVSIQLGRYSNDSSMSPVWHNAIKETCERSAWSHIHLSTRLQELLRDVQSYSYELRKKRKRMKEVEARTETVVDQFRASKAQLQRTREIYMNLAMDVDRLKKGSTSSDAANVSGDKQVYNASTMPLQQSHSATNFPIGMMLSSPQRIEKKLQQAVDEYKQAIERYNASRDEYIRLFTDSCHSFQTYEEAHVQQMSKFVMQFAQQSEQLNSAREQINVDLKQKLDNVYSVDSLIQQFLAQKGTGHELPEVAEFVEFVPGTINDINASTASVDSGGGITSTSSYFSLRKRSPPRKHESRSPSQPSQVLDPFELVPTTTSSPTSSHRATTPNGENSSIGNNSSIRKRTIADNRLLGIFNLDFFGKRMNSISSTGSGGGGGGLITHHRRATNRDSESNQPTLAESQLIDLTTDSSITTKPATTGNTNEEHQINLDDKKMVTREMFQRARPMRIIARVTKKKRQNSLPSSEPEIADHEDEREVPRSSRNRAQTTNEPKPGSLVTATSMNIRNNLDEDDDDDDDFDDAEFDNLRTKGLELDHTLDDEDSFFRELEELKLKKGLSPGRKDSADMNNLYVAESSLESSNDSKKNSKYQSKKQSSKSLKTPLSSVDHNNNNVVSHAAEDKSLSSRPTHSDSDTETDTDSDDSDSFKIHVKINPFAETNTTSDMVLSQIGKSLKLSTLNSSTPPPTSNRPTRALSPPPQTPQQQSQNLPPFPSTSPSFSSIQISTKSVDKADETPDKSIGGVNLMKFKQTNFGSSTTASSTPSPSPIPSSITTTTQIPQMPAQQRKAPPVPPLPLALKLRAAQQNLSNVVTPAISTNATVTTLPPSNDSKNNNEIDNSTDYVIKF